MRPVRHTSITPNLLSTRCMATVCRAGQQSNTTGVGHELLRAFQVSE
jgi:hypothetical protein